MAIALAHPESGSQVIEVGDDSKRGPVLRHVLLTVLRQQPGDDLDRRAAAETGGMRVPQHVRGEGDPGALDAEASVGERQQLRG
jgi:hypothetical protein